MTLHSKTLVSSTKPAENPSTGCLQRSTGEKQNSVIKSRADQNKTYVFVKNQNLRQEIQLKKKSEKEFELLIKNTFELFLKQKAGLCGHQKLKNAKRPPLGGRIKKKPLPISLTYIEDIPVLVKRRKRLKRRHGNKFLFFFSFVYSFWVQVALHLMRSLISS